MGKSYSNISFMCLDSTPIEVVSASKQENFNMKTLNDFINIRGTFMNNDDDSSNYVFNKENGDFVEFNISHN